MSELAERVNPEAQAAELKEYWSQKFLAKANGLIFKVAKGVGATNWHKHDDQDEVFFVLHGRLSIDLRDRSVVLEKGDFFVVPCGVEHRPHAEAEVLLLVAGTSVTSTSEGGKPDWSLRASADAG